MDLVLDSSRQFTIYSGKCFDSIQVRLVLEPIEHEIGDDYQHHKGQVGTDEDPDLIPVIRCIFNFFFYVGLLETDHVFFNLIIPVSV